MSPETSKETISILNPYSCVFVYTQIGLWVLYGVIFRILWLGYNAPPPSWFVVYVCSGFFVTTLLSIVYWRIRLKPFAQQFVIALFLSTLIAVLWRIGFNIIDFHLYDRESLDEITLFRYVYRGSSSMLQLYGWSAMYFLLAYYLKYAHQRERRLKAELLTKEAQLKQLQHQVSPHLIFNVLHSLDTLLLKHDVDGSRSMVEKLSSFLRQALKDGANYQISLEEEITQTKHYLDIEHSRFRDKLDVNWHYPNPLPKLMVPSLILQPIIENSIKHSLEKSIYGTTININIELHPEHIEINVTDSRQNEANLNPNETREKDNDATGFGIGLKNVEQRIKLFFGDDAQMSASPLTDNSFQVFLRLPLLAQRQASLTDTESRYD